MKKKVLFIINPISGGKKKDDVPALISNYLNTAAFEYELAFSVGVADARKIAEGKKDDFDIIVAVGGDGTINEIASAIVGSKTILGVIPYGSGNGLSRFLQIPMNAKAAIETINNMRVELIDSARLNGQPFFNMAGMGFDAHISDVFSRQTKRGFYSYFKSAVVEVVNYKSQTYQIIVDGVKHESIAFMLSIANSSQYGNNAHISPAASVQDGLLDVCIVRPFPLYLFPAVALRMFNKTAHQSKFLTIVQGKEVKILRQQQAPVHLDGEPQIMGNEIEIKMIPQSLNIIVGSKF